MIPAYILKETILSQLIMYKASHHFLLVSTCWFTSRVVEMVTQRSFVVKLQRECSVPERLGQAFSLVPLVFIAMLCIRTWYVQESTTQTRFTSDANEMHTANRATWMWRREENIHYPFITRNSGKSFLGSNIPAHGDCSHEIKRCLLLGRKVMTNLDSIFKSRDITLPTKIRLVKAMVFPVVMYGCESWTIKKAEHSKIDDFKLWCWRRLLRVLGLWGDPTSPF